MNQEVLTSRAAKSSAQIGLYAASFLANFMKRYLLAAQNKEQFKTKLSNFKILMEILILVPLHNKSAKIKTSNSVTTVESILK